MQREQNPQWRAMQANIADVPGKSESGYTSMPDMVQMML